jgi:hypothetical protein
MKQPGFVANGRRHWLAGSLLGKSGQIMRVHRGYSDAGVDDGTEDFNKAFAE